MLLVNRSNLPLIDIESPLGQQLTWAPGGLTTHGSTVTAAELRTRTAQITIRFVSKLISVTRGRTGNVIDGNAEKVTDVTDVWTFAREVSSRDPNWKVVATEAGQ